MRSFTIDKTAISTFASIEVFLFQASGLRTALQTIDTSQMLDDVARLAREAQRTSEALAETPLAAGWRSVFRQMGLKPSVHRSSIEALLRRALAQKPIAIGVPIVDFYNAFSLLHRACLGGYDLRKTGERSMVLRRCRPDDDRFIPLGGEPGDFPLHTGVLVYALGSNVVCWGLNCRDSVSTSLDAETDEAVFAAEGVTASQIDSARTALAAMAERLEQAGARVSPVLRCSSLQPAIQLHHQPEETRLGLPQVRS